MDIRDILTGEYERFEGDTRVSELEGYFRETNAKAVVITENGDYRGVITQRQLGSAQESPNRKARSLIWRIGRVDIDDDVRTVARLMVGSSAMVLPVFEDETMVGLVTAEDLLAKVQPFLHVLTVEDVFSPDLVTIGPDSSLGNVLHLLREERITHLPVIENESVVGIVSIFDLIDFTTKPIDRSQGGSPSPAIETGGGRSRGGFGERGGELERLLELPARNAMSEPVETISGHGGLDEAVDTMLERDISSLVVTEAGRPTGIVTKTDVLRALTVPDETRLPIQITNIHLLDDISRGEIADLIRDTTRKYGDMSVLEANVFLHEHDETLRGTPLIMARIRLFTDRGHFVGTGEGYGARHAIHLAGNVVEREILEGRDYGRTKKHPSEEVRSKLYGWWLTGSSGPRY